MKTDILSSNFEGVRFLSSLGRVPQRKQERYRRVTSHKELEFSVCNFSDEYQLSDPTATAISEHAIDFSESK